MTDYVQQPSVDPFTWGKGHIGTAHYKVREFVEDQYNSTSDKADTMLNLLIGADGTSGYLNDLNNIIEDYAPLSVTVDSVNVPDVAVSPDARPAIDTSGLDTNFPDFTTPAPTLDPIPGVDLSDLNPADLPEEVSAAINWFESTYDDSLYAELYNRIITDIQSGAYGLGGTVEQEIYDRASARQDILDQKQYDEINEYFTSRGFDLPSGAHAARLAEAQAESVRNRTELNGKIYIEQAELAQKNNQFVIGIIKELEVLLRDDHAKKNDRSLDYSKAVAANAIALYAENVRAYLAAAEANKIYVQVQVENLRAVVEQNKALVDSYQAEAQAYEATISARAKKNEALIGAIDADIKSYEAETRAIAASNEIQMRSWEARIKDAELQLQASVAEAENALQGYTATSQLRERVAESMANIAMQSVASALGAFNASAGMTSTMRTGLSENYSHNESRAESRRVSANLGESHNYAHDT